MTRKRTIPNETNAACTAPRGDCTPCSPVLAARWALLWPLWDMLMLWGDQTGVVYFHVVNAHSSARGYSTIWRASQGCGLCTRILRFSIQPFTILRKGFSGPTKGAHLAPLSA